MTESPFPFQPAAPAPDVAEEPPASDRRVLLGLGGLAVVLLAGGSFFFLTGGPDPDQEVVNAGTVPRTASAAPSGVVTLPVATQLQLGRNPFAALYIQPAETQAPVAVAEPLPSPEAAQPIVVVVPAASSAPAASPSPAAPTDQEYVLVLQDVYGMDTDRSAVFVVDGKQMTAQVGTVFGPTAEIKLVLLQEGPGADQWTATLQVGDGDPFDVVTGEAVFVR